MDLRVPPDFGRPQYERHIGGRISFDQPVNSVAIAAATLALPMPNADPQLFKLVKRYCEDEVERQKAIDHPLNRIREFMIRCLQRGSFGPKHVAQELGLTPSSLHRRLKAEGTSFHRLLDDTRRCLTHRYLLESSLKLTDIAALVGYSELSAFSRAARRWFGTSPAPSAAGRLTSTLRPEQRLRVAKDLPVIESKLVLPPVGDPLRAGGIGA